MFSVALIGPDGAGKTTVSARVRESLGLPVQYVYMGINADSSNCMLPTTRLLHAVKRARGKPVDTGPRDPGRPRPRPGNPLKRLARSVKSCLLMANRMAEEWYRQFVAWRYKRRGHIVLFDRHFLFDFYSFDVAGLVDDRRALRRLHGWMLTRLYPRPDLVICLDAPGEVLYARKGEGTPELLEQKRQEYLRIGSLVEHFVVIDATLPEDEVVRRVVECISNHYASVSAPQADQRQTKHKEQSTKTKKQQTVLITDARLPSALAIVRSLGRHGYRVVAADSDPTSLGFRSRYAHERVVCPSPESSPQEFVESLRIAAAAHRVDLIVPVTDAAILPLSESRERFRGICRLAIADAAALEITTAKDRTLELAARLGVPTPRTVLVHSASEALESADELGWPIVLKPQVSRLYRAVVSGEWSVVSGDEPARVPSHDSRLTTHQSPLIVSYAGDRAGLEREMRRFEGRCPILLQEYCRGTGYGVELLTERGRPLAAFQHKRLREVPITGGASSLRESVPLDPELYRHSVRLLEALEWTGLAMVEFKVDGEAAKLMEINGRVWGSLPLAVHSGMDFPARLAELCLSLEKGAGVRSQKSEVRGQRSEVSGPQATDQSAIRNLQSAIRPHHSPLTTHDCDTSYRTGVRARNLDLDLVWIGSVLVGRRKHPCVPAPSRWRAIAAMFGLLNPFCKSDAMSWSDPIPAIAQWIEILRKAPARLLRSRKRAAEAGKLGPAREHPGKEVESCSV